MRRIERSFDSLSGMLRAALGDRLDPSGTSFDAMLDEDAVMEFPYAPPGPARVEGKAAIMDHQKMLAQRVAMAAMNHPVVYETGDPDIVIIEVEGVGKGLETGAPHIQNYVYVIHTRGGRIVRFRDYWNPVNYLKAL